MSYTCTKCGLISEKKVSRCPECFGRVRFFPQDANRIEGAILNSQTLLSKVKYMVDDNLEQAEKHLDIGTDHIHRDYFDSAANTFRKSMEYLLNSWCLLLSGNNYFYELRGWICWNQKLRCKSLDDIKIKPAEQIAFCLDIGLISQISHNDFNILRATGNRGSHAGNEVNIYEAIQAEETLRNAIEDFKQFYTNLAAYSDTPE